MSGKYLIFNPGEYYDWEKPFADERFAMAKANIVAKQKLVKGPPKPAAEEDILAFNKRWNPYDPLYNNTEYARSLGLPGVPAYPGFGSPRATSVPGFPKDIGDAFYFTNDGSVFRYERNIFAGDILIPSEYTVDFRDITVPGSDLRCWYMGGIRAYRDQKGMVIVNSDTNTRDCYRKLADNSGKKTFTENMMEWCEYFPPPHVTTDADWERIKSLWSQEVLRGEDTPFWEDVYVGLEIPKTCTNGPVTYMHMNYWHYIDDWSIYTREQLSDPGFNKTAFRDPYGQILEETSIHYGGRNLPGSRMVWYNNTGAYIIARTVTNFIGTNGRVSMFGWRLFPLFKELRNWPVAADLFKNVKGMEGRDCDRHGSEGDTCIGRAVVTDKYVNDKGEHVVDFTVWGETLDGDIIQACPMAAVLPLKKGKK